MVYLVPPGRGNHSPLVLVYDTKRRDELPLQIDLKRNDRVAVLGVEYRCSQPANTPALMAKTEKPR